MATAVIGLAIGAANLIQQNRQAKKQEAAQIEGNAIASAAEKTKDIRARRRNAREERIRRARLLQSSSTAGTEGSSGQIGASSALSANFGASVAVQREGQTTSQGLTAASQREAKAVSRARTFQAFADFAQAGLDVASGS